METLLLNVCEKSYLLSLEAAALYFGHFVVTGGKRIKFHNMLSG